MATLTTGAGYAVRMDQLDVSDINDGDVVTQTSTQESIASDDGFLNTFIGTGFTYSNGMPTGGTVTEYDLAYNGALVFKVTGASVGAQALYTAISGGDTVGTFDLFFGGDDTFSGGSLDDYLDARAGNNVVNGGAGADVLIAGSGNNHIYGNALGTVQGTADGGDVISVGGGTNYINGNGGNDEISAGDGVNRVYGGSGDDEIVLGNGNNTVNGNIGNDVIVVGNGSNVLRGGQGDDQFFTNQATAANGNAQMGDLGNDQFHTGIGYDLMTGGAGNDVFWLGGQAQHGSGAASIGGGTYYDEVTDFNAAEDHLVMRTFVPDAVKVDTASHTTEADAQAAAQAQLTASNDAHAVIASHVGQDTFLFFNSAGSSTSIDAYLKLDGVAPEAITTGSFLDPGSF